MSNENFLQGMQCPKCKSVGNFWFETKALFQWGADSAVHDGGQIEWVDEGFAQCISCHHMGKVKDFYIENHPAVDKPES